MVSSSTGLVGPSKACWPGVWRSSIRARRLSQPSLLARFTLDNVSFFGELTRRRPRASRRDSSYTALRAVLQPHIRFCDELIADALSPLPRACGASAHQLAAAEAPSAASLADAFGCDTVAFVLFPEAAAPASASPASRFVLAVIGIDHGRRLEARTSRIERV